jgi:hypothetical protein
MKPYDGLVNIKEGFIVVEANCLRNGQNANVDIDNHYNIFGVIEILKTLKKQNPDKTHYTSKNIEK